MKSISTYVLTGNQLIAEWLGAQIGDNMILNFTGAELIPDTEIPFYCDIIELQYHNSYDWLMPVVERIESFGYTTSFKTHYCRINPVEGDYMDVIVQCHCGFAYRRLDDGFNINTNTILLDNAEIFDKVYLKSYEGEIAKKLDMIYVCVVEFIKWLNQEEK